MVIPCTTFCYGARAWADVAPWWGTFFAVVDGYMQTVLSQNQPTDFLVWGMPVIADFRFFDSESLIDRNGLRHMSDGPYKRHEPIVSEARFQGRDVRCR